MTQFHRLILPVHVHLYENHIPVYNIAIAFHTIYFLIVMQKLYFRL